MIKKDIVRKFEEMFDLDSINDEESVRNVESDDSFNKLEEEEQRSIGEMEQKGASLEVEDPHDIIMDVSSNVVEETKKEKKDEIIFEDDFDELDVSDFNNKITVKIKEIMVEEKIIKEEIVEEKIIKEEIVEEDYKIECNSDKMAWALKSPVAMYDNFYIRKNIILKECLFGGEIEYIRWTRELQEAQVDIITEVFDQHVIMRQMEEIQQYRDRVKYIAVKVNNQYYAFNRYVEMLRGYLAKIQYLKPILKQDGLILEHMGDIELYFQRLKALHNSVSITENNLAAAYEMLSRKVTICMELPPVERFDKKNSYHSKFSSDISEKEEKFNSNLEEYDELPKNAESGPKEQKVGKMSWGEI